MFKVNDRVVWIDPLDNMDFFGTVTHIDTFNNRVSVKWDEGLTERMNPNALRIVNSSEFSETLAQLP